MDAAIAGWLPARYRLRERLGAGGMGEVWLADDLEKSAPVAVKRLKLGGANREEGEADRLRFKREFLILSRMESPAIVRAFEAGETERDCFYTMEPVAGWLLKDYLRGGFWRDPPAPAENHFESAAGLERLWALGEELLGALDYLHERALIHRDLKPGNLMVTPAGRLKLIDFGLARGAREEFSVTGAGEVLGTPYYIAPEQLRSQPLDGRADLYSAGVILYELAVGEPPFTGGSVADILMGHLQRAPVSPRARNRLISPAHSALILRLLAKAPAGRPPSAREALWALRAAGDEAGAADAQPAVEITAALARTAAVGAAALAEGGPARLLIAPYTGNAEARAAALEGGEKLLSGEGRALLVAGPPGAGKSRLNDELRAFGAEHGLKIFHGVALEQGGTAGQLFQEVFAQIAEQLARRPELRASWLGEDGPALALHFPALRRLAGPDARPLDRLEPEAERARLLAACFGLFSRVAAAAPVALLLEDLHWADPLSLDLAAHLVHSFTGARGEGLPPLLILANHRDDEAALAGPLGKWRRGLEAAGARALRLAPLAENEMGALIAALLGLSDPPPEAFVARLRELTGGNPFFAVETLKALLEAGELRRLPLAGDGGWDFAGWLAGDRNRRTGGALPSSIRAALVRRLAELEERERSALRAAALIAREFEFAWWPAVSGLAEDALIEIADRAIRRGILQERGSGTLMFAHDQLRAALLEGLSGLKKRRLHGKILAALEAEGRTGARLELLAEHAIEGGDRSAALRHGHAAAVKLGVLNQRETLLALLERIAGCFTPEAPMAPADRLEHLRLKAKTLSVLGDSSGSIVLAEEGLALARRPEDDAVAADLWLTRSWAQRDTGDYAGEVAAARKARELARARNLPVTEVAALRSWSWGLFSLGRIAESAPLLDEALALARRMNNEAQYGHALTSRSFAAFSVGDLEAAARDGREARDCFTRINDALGIAMNTGNLGEIALLQGDLPAAEQTLARAHRINRELGNRAGLCDNLNQLGLCALWRGRLEGARAILDEAVALARRLGNRYYEGFALIYRAELAARLGDGAEAAEKIAAAVRLGRETRNPALEAKAEAAAARIAFRSGDFAGAAAAASRAAALAAERFQDSEALALAVQEAARRLGGAAPDPDALPRAARLSEKCRNRELMLNVGLLDALAQHDPDGESARRALREVAAQAGALGMRHLVEWAEAAASAPPLE